MVQLDRIEDFEAIDLFKTDKSKEYEIFHYNYFGNGFKSDWKICNRDDSGITSFGNFAKTKMTLATYVLCLIWLNKKWLSSYGFWTRW